MEKLYRGNKRTVKAGDELHFRYGDKYLIINIIDNGGCGLFYTLQDIKTKQVIYCYPSSHCYGSEIIRN